MAKILRIVNGQALGVYDDRLMPIYRALGVPEITRASEVEYDPASGMWVAIERATGVEIARSVSRAECIRSEVTYLEAKIVTHYKG